MNQGDSNAYVFNMQNLIMLIKKQFEKNAAASYFNVDILKYQVIFKQTFFSFDVISIVFSVVFICLLDSLELYSSSKELSQYLPLLASHSM